MQNLIYKTLYTFAFLTYLNIREQKKTQPFSLSFIALGNVPLSLTHVNPEIELR